MLPTTALAQIALLVGLPSLVTAEPIPGNYHNGGNNGGNNGGLLGLGNILGVGGGNNNNGGLLGLGNVLGVGGGSNHGGGGNNGGENSGGINLGGGGGLLGTGIDLGAGVGLDVDLDLSTGRPESHDWKKDGKKSGKVRRAEPEVDEEILVRRQSGDAAEALRLHNAKRASRGIAALTWDPALASAAQTWANRLAQLDRFEHSPGNTRPGQGENLAYAWSTAPITNPMSQGTQAWLNEEKNYNNEVIPQGNFAAYGHYTQCMWRNTNRVGIATASNGRGAWYTVARYSPQGNINGQRPY